MNATTIHNTQQQQQELQPMASMTAAAAKVTTAASTSTRSNYYSLKKKRKCLQQQQQPLESQTIKGQSAPRTFELCLRTECEIAMPATTTTTPTTTMTESCNNICLICRQQLATCCLRCCEQLLLSATATSKTTTSTTCITNTTTCSCQNRCRCSSDNNNNSKSSSCSHLLIAAATTTTKTNTTTVAASSCCCCLKQHNSSCAASTTTTTKIPTTLPNFSSNKVGNCQSFQETPTTATAKTTPTCRTSLATAAENVTELLLIADSNNNCNNQIFSAATLKTSPSSPTTTATYKCSALFNNALQTFQLLMLFTQMLLVQLFAKKRRRQQSLSFTRLRFRSNSYKAATTTTTSRIQHHQQHEQQNHQRQQHHHQQQQQHQRPKMRFQQQQPNYSALYIILIILSFMSSFLPATQAQMPHQQQQQQQVTLTRNETVCKSLDIRNTPEEFSQLRNCTVIEGFLLITLIGTHPDKNGTKEVAQVFESFPLLTEVTEFVVIYRVHNLRSLSQIFPNLSIIRGRNLFEIYALVVYSNPHIEDLGLGKLLTISRGGVRIENNLSLCYVETIDWTSIVSNTTDILIQKNRATVECPKCPSENKASGQDLLPGENDFSCKERQGRRHCWNSSTCQKFCPASCPDNCLDEKTCCNDSCLGGCSQTNLNVCTSCRHFSIHNSTCTDSCPRDYYSYLYRRCITGESCARIGSKFENSKEEQLVPFNGQCSTRCPEGYKKVNGTCQKCNGKCEKHCPGGLIDSVARAKDYHGCTHIIESGLTISIKRGGRHLMEDLEFGLSSIEVIETFLKVHRTYGMFSLEYFKNLREISGNMLCEEKFALYILENNDLETIWRKNQTVRIEDGRVFFHFNPKLCVNVIEELRPMLRHNGTFDKNEVATDSNGSKGSCNTEVLNTTIDRSSDTAVIVKIVTPLVFEDERTFIGYQYFYMEDKDKKATKHAHRPCDDGWTTGEPTKDTNHLFVNLKPFTQYAYYVKTMTISSEPRNAESPIQFFKTKSAQPNAVKIMQKYAKSSSEIVISWQPPTHANGNLTKYRVHIIRDTRNQKVETRNYCNDPLKEAALPSAIDNQPVTEKPTAAADCKCAKDKDSGVDNEDDDAVRHDQIDFENTVQNFVYVKQSNKTSNNDSSARNAIRTEQRRRRSIADDDMEYDSFIVRHMRAVTDDSSGTIDNTTPTNMISKGATITPATDTVTVTSSTSTTTTMESLFQYANISVNGTQKDDNDLYTEFTADVNATTTEFVFQNLQHFSVHQLSVSACREPEQGATRPECSVETTFHMRTQQKEGVDKVENLLATFEPTNTTRGNILVRWDPPENPNGAIVSYTITYMHMIPDAVEEKRCISETDYLNNTNGYLLRYLPAGNYKIRVRANSLAGEGTFSDYRYVYIKPPQISNTVIVIICIAVLILIGLIIGVSCYVRKKIQKTPNDLKIFPTVNPYYISLQYIPDDWEVPRERVLQLSPLGQGSFGMVYEGILKGYNNSNEDTPCAIKTVNENATDRERMNFLNEASVMKQFDTYHVVRLLGVCSRGQPALVVMELMKNGDLKSYLRAHRPDEREDIMMGIGELPVQPPPLSRIYQMAVEIADGMAYLAAKKFVHRDLAARNCMVAIDLTVKIGDFGMTRDIYETDYYRKGTKGLLPVRWMPPESLRDGVYSSASDVFSYGVVLWEMATLASQPYQGLSNDQVLRYVIDGGVMERPENCPDKLYRLMQRCWHHRPSARPSFNDIIRLLLDSADPHFREVSFYHSDEGQQMRNKEIHECLQHSGDVFHDHDNDTDDVTTPLRVGEYNDYKLNMENTSSVENHNESPMVNEDEHHPHSPYSLGSAHIISSTPDGKNSYNLSQMSHNNPTLSSAPSTSAGIISGGGGVGSHPQQPPFLRHTRYPSQSQSQPHGDEAAYVQPDYNARNYDNEEITLGRNIAKSADEERGYEVYDPSPNYREHAPSYDAEDEEFDGLHKMSGAKSLLPKQRQRQRMPTIQPMSSSMPDEVISAPMASSLHPSTASAASSNASSTATTGVSGKYPSLKRAVADTVQNVGNSLVPQRLRNMNRFFNHKRSGSNTSHRSTGSNPNSTHSNSNLSQQHEQVQNSGSGGLVSSGRGKSVSGSNLGTIESGGSGSAGSYAPTAPRFFTSHASENPNYKLLDETANVSGFSAADATPNTNKAKTGYTTSGNPNYQLLNESLNVSLTPQKLPPFAAALPPSLLRPTNISDNPNYELMQAPELSTSDNPNYVLMNQPQEMEPFPAAPLNLSENPNYQMMGPLPSTTRKTPANSGAIAYSLHRQQPAVSLGLCNSSQSASATSSDEATHDDDDDDDDDDDGGAEKDNETHAQSIKMARMPLTQSRRGSERSRSRSQSQTKNDAAVSTPTPATSTSYQLKEKFLRQQQPPNGFIGRDG